MLLLLCLIAVLSQQQQHAAFAADLPTQATKPAFIAIGDGLTEGAFSRKHDGWGLLLQERYVRKADVVNRGFGGYFTSWIVNYMLDDLYNVPNAVCAILFLGTKDTLTQHASGKHYTTPQQFGQNVDKIIQKGKNAGVKYFLLISPPPVCETCKKNKTKPWDRENAHSALYVEQLKSLAAKHGAGFLNIFEEWQKDPKWADKLLQRDKLHLSSAGNKLLFKQMQEVIAAQVPDMAWEHVPHHYPLMDSIDKDNPGPAFDKVRHSNGKKTPQKDSKEIADISTGRSSIASIYDSSSSNSITSRASSLKQGLLSTEQGPQSSSAGGLSAYRIAWMLLGMAVTLWQL